MGNQGVSQRGITAINVKLFQSNNSLQELPRVSLCEVMWLVGGSYSMKMKYETTSLEINL